jgi:hypothetical protein
MNGYLLSEGCRVFFFKVKQFKNGALRGPVNGSTAFLRNVGKYLPLERVSRHKRFESAEVPISSPEIYFLVL